MVSGAEKMRRRFPCGLWPTKPGERLMKKDLTPILRSLYFCISVANNLRSRKELARMSIFFRVRL